MQPSIYLCGKISGISYDDATIWRKEIARLLSPYFFVLDPMRGKESLAAGGPLPLARSNYKVGGVLTSSAAIVARDLTDVRRADLLIVHFGSMENTGFFTAYEMGMATALGKPIIVIVDPANPVTERVVIKSGPLLVCVDTIEDACILARSMFAV
jgi:nucleoside 2-deoxyribosyltransferase